MTPSTPAPTDAGVLADGHMTYNSIEAAFTAYRKTLTVMDKPANFDSFGSGYVTGWNAKEASLQETRGDEPVAEHRWIIDDRENAARNARLQLERDQLRAASQQSPRMEREGLVRQCADVVGNMRQSEAGLFDAKHSGQRGCDRADALYDAYVAILALLSPDTTVVSSTSQVSPGFTQCARCWQPATCKKYGCSEPVSSNHPREISK